ncbi:MAG TPA: c-type cytochrome [Vicinamibacteria bacterium]|nr:c-type cytochrome [Vicinamibacteria bacterium]
MLLLTLAGAGAVGGGAFLVLVRHGLSARDEPTAMEAWMARATRRLATPRRIREARSPVPLTGEAVARARAHFADHCASCHGNDGRGQTTVGRNLYPKAPDMSQPATQSLSDGELYSIIRNGVRLTGMPAWGGDTAEDDRETWELVLFIRRLPAITPEEARQMEALNPRSPKEYEEEEEARRFLEGRDAPAPPPAQKH